MRELLPHPDDDPDLARLDDRSDRRAPAGRPWVMANMVMSVDGAYAVEGRSGGLGSPGDRTVFHRLRGAADVILAAAGTVRAERYRRPHSDDATATRRVAQGLARDPRLVVVSASLHLPDDLPLLDGPGVPPLVLHPEDAQMDAVPHGVELRAVGSGGSVDLDAALAGLARDGVSVVLCEGGPGLLGQLHRADLIDELFVTISPSMVGGTDLGLLGGGAAVQRPMHLHRLWEQDESLFATYRRT